MGNCGQFDWSSFPGTEGFYSQQEAGTERVKANLLINEAFYQTVLLSKSCSDPRECLFEFSMFDWFSWLIKLIRLTK